MYVKKTLAVEHFCLFNRLIRRSLSNPKTKHIFVSTKQQHQGHPQNFEIKLLDFLWYDLNAGANITKQPIFEWEIKGRTLAIRLLTIESLLTQVKSQSLISSTLIQLPRISIQVAGSWPSSETNLFHPIRVLRAQEPMLY